MFQHSLRNLNRNNLWFLANANTDSKLKINVLKSKYNCNYFETLTKIQYMVFPIIYLKLVPSHIPRICLCPSRNPPFRPYSI